MTKWVGTPDTLLYETSIETAVMDHFITKLRRRRTPPSPSHYTSESRQETRISMRLDIVNVCVLSTITALGPAIINIIID